MWVRGPINWLEAVFRWWMNPPDWVWDKMGLSRAMNGDSLALILGSEWCHLEISWRTEQKYFFHRSYQSEGPSLSAALIRIYGPHSFKIQKYSTRARVAALKCHCIWVATFWLTKDIYGADGTKSNKLEPRLPNNYSHANFGHSTKIKTKLPLAALTSPPTVWLAHPCIRICICICACSLPP